MTWFLILDLDEWEPSWPASYLGSKVTLARRSHLGEEDLPSNFRVSPLFPLERGQPSLLTPSTGNWILNFLCPADPFREIGRLSTKLEHEHRMRIWFSVGTAALVIISQDDDYLGEISPYLSYPDLPREEWVVTDGQLANVKVHLGTTPNIPSERPQPPNYSNLPLDLRGVVDEFVTSLNTLLAPVERVRSNEIGLYHSLAEDVYEMVEEMLYLSDPSSFENPPHGLGDHEASELASNAALRVKLIHQRTDRVVQVNSALSYLSSQLYSGVPPILERRCLIRRYSLLGIGTAVRALLRLSSHTEKAFAKGNVESVLFNTLSSTTSRPLPGLFASYGPDSAGWERLGVSEGAASASEMKRPPKLVYFSGRLGFREAEFAVSAAIQVLWAGDTLEWSPSTMSHELLHGHVRNILSQIFRTPDGLNSRKFNTEMYNRFADARRRRSTEDMTTLDSIRYVLLSYCSDYTLFGSLTSSPSKEMQADRDKITNSLKICPEEILWKRLESQYRNISEILVHVLDFHYFYRSRIEIYLPFIWRSWAAVPIVVRDLRQYILRSLLTVASLERGKARQRFDNSIDSLKRHLSANPSLPGNHALIERVLRYIDDSSRVEEMYLPFATAIPIVDLARYVLLSKPVRATLFAGDDLIELHESAEGDRFSYSLGEMEFQDVQVASPTAFLLDRLQRLMEQDVSETSSDRRTAWLMLALASEPRGGDEQ